MHRKQAKSTPAAMPAILKRITGIGIQACLFKDLFWTIFIQIKANAATLRLLSRRGSVMRVTYACDKSVLLFPYFSRSRDIGEEI